MDIPVYNMQGKQTGTVSIDTASLGGTLNAPLIKQAYVMYHANTRQGSARTLNRHNVEGSTRKIYKQKGTGRARHGDKKVPQFKGGGHTFAKTRDRESYHKDMPKKMRRIANRNALLAKLMDSEVKVVESLDMPTPKTKPFVDFLSAVNIDKTALVAVDPANKNIRLSARNIDNVTLTTPDQLTCFNMLNHRYLIISKSDLESWLNGPWSQTDKRAKLEPMGRAADSGEEAA